MPLHDTVEDHRLESGGGVQRRTAALAKLSVVLAIGLSAVGCGPREDPDLVAGRALYEENCRMCHGDRALGDGPMAATLPVQPASLVEHLGHHTMAELTRLVTGGIPPAMPPAPVDAAQLQLIVDYVWTLVPEDRVDALREMQRQMEMMGTGAGAMPRMDMDHSQMPGMQGDSTEPNPAPMPPM